MNPIPHKPDEIAEPRQILLATDLRDSDYLLPIAIEQAKSTGAHLTLVHTFFNRAVPSTDTQDPLSPDGEMDAEEFAERILSDLVKKARTQGITCDSIVRQGCSTVEALRDEIRNTGAERVIIGTRGVGRMAQQALGSVARSVLRSLEVPILAVSPHARASQRFAVPRRILHPVSLQGFYRENVEVARRLAEFHNAELILFHAIEWDAHEDSGNERDLDRVRHELNVLAQTPLARINNARTHASHGEVIDKILQTASRFDADWIVLGWNEKRQHPAFMQSVAYRVMTAASVPVFTLPRYLPQAAVQARQRTA